MADKSLTGAWRGGGFIYGVDQNGARNGPQIDIDLRTAFVQAGRHLMGGGHLLVSMLGSQRDAGDKQITGTVDGATVNFTLPGQVSAITGQPTQSYFKGVLSPCGNMIEGSWGASHLDSLRQEIAAKYQTELPEYQSYFLLERQTDDTPSEKLETPVQIKHDLTV